MYQKTKHNYQCISRCYEKGSTINHPITTAEIHETSKNFCAINPIYDPKAKIVVIVDECELSKNSDIPTDAHDPFARIEAKTMELLYPNIAFNAKYFLRTYYSITTTTEFYEWFHNNKFAPIFTIVRMIDCFILAFGSQVSIIDDVFIESLIGIIKGFWIKKIYYNLHKFIGIKDDKCIIVDPKKNKLDIREQSKMRKQFIMSELLTPQIIMEYTTSYFAQLPDLPNGTEDLMTFIIQKMLDAQK